jgi:hypothetical protein
MTPSGDGVSRATSQLAQVLSWRDVGVSVCSSDMLMLDLSMVGGGLSGSTKEQVGEPAKLVGEVGVGVGAVLHPPPSPPLVLLVLLV